MKSDPKRPWWAGPEKPPGWLAIIFCLAFFGAFPALGIYYLVGAVHQGIDAEVTQGTVIALEPERHRTGERETYFAVVEYQVGNKHYRCRGPATSPPLHYAGQKVQVLYQRQAPEVGFIDSFVDRWLAGLLCTVIGLPLFAWTIFSLFFSRMFYNWLSSRAP